MYRLVAVANPHPVHTQKTLTPGTICIHDDVSVIVSFIKKFQDDPNGPSINLVVEESSSANMPDLLLGFEKEKTVVCMSRYDPKNEWLVTFYGNDFRHGVMLTETYIGKEVIKKEKRRDRPWE